jgi:hypothetical protein
MAVMALVLATGVPGLSDFPSTAEDAFAGAQAHRDTGL